MRRDIYSVLQIVVGSLVFLLAGLNALVWSSSGGIWQVVLRVALLLLAIVMIARGALRWSKNHSDTLPRAAKLQAGSQFSPYVGADLRQALDDGLALVPRMRGEELLRLADIIVAPTRYRERVEEEQEVVGSTTRVSVRLVMHNLPVAGTSLLPVIALTRHLKESPYGNLAAETKSGERVDTLGFISGLGVSYAVALAFVSAHVIAMRPDDRLDVQNKLAQIVASAADSTHEIEELEKLMVSTSLWQNPAYEEDKAAFLSFMRVVAKRRVVYISLKPSDPKLEIKYSFTASHRGDPDIPPGYDRWRAWKDSLRERCNLQSKFVSVSLARSRAVDSYKLHVKVPEGLYIEEAHIFAGNALVPPMDRYVAYRSHVSHSILNGRPDLRVSAWRMRRVASYTNPVVFVRLSEAPPGSIFTSALVALGVVVTTWLTGVISGASLRGGVSGAPSVDMAALAVTLPGLLVAWLGLAAPSVTNGYRSLAALFSLGVSAFLALASTGTYVGRFAIVRLPKALFPSGKSFFFVQDYVSACLLFLALLNFGLIGGLFLSRLRRYLNLRKNSEGPHVGEGTQA